MTLEETSTLFHNTSQQCSSISKRETVKRKQTLPEDRGALHLCAIEIEDVEEILQVYATTNQK